MVDDLIIQLKSSEFNLPPLATGEWNWINNKYRNECVRTLYNREWDDLRTHLLNPQSPSAVYGIITPVDSSNEASIFNNDFLQDLELLRSSHSIDEFEALKHEYLLKHPWSMDTEPCFTYPDSPRHADFALRIIQVFKNVTSKKTGLEIGGTWGLNLFFKKVWFRWKLINCNLLETLLVSFVFMRCNGLNIRLCLSQQDLVEALKDQDQVILITTSLFKYINEMDWVSFVFNSRSFS